MAATMQLFDQLFGRKEQRWFDNGAVGARQGKFAGVAVSDGRKIQVLGTTVSREGIAFVAPKPIVETELNFTFKLRERAIPSRVHVERGEAMQARDSIVHRYFCTFTAIAADDWDAVVRYVDNVPEPKKADFTPKVDNDFRTLPVAVQSGIVDMLVKAKRLAAPAAGTVPLIRMIAGSIRESAPGVSVQDVLIHSRISVGGDVRNYDTKFRVSSSQKIELLT